MRVHVSHPLSRVWPKLRGPLRIKKTGISPPHHTGYGRQRNIRELTTLTIESDWQEIPGTEGARILPLTRKPDVCCSNAYLVATEHEVIVIDTGADEAQMETIVSTVEALTAERPCPICLFITHCHLDRRRRGRGGPRKR